MSNKRSRYQAGYELINKTVDEVVILHIDLKKLNRKLKRKREKSEVLMKTVFIEAHSLKQVKLAAEREEIIVHESTKII